MARIDVKISFCIVFEEPLKTIAVSKYDLEEECSSGAKSISPRNTPGLVDSDCSSWPLKGSS